MPNKDKKGFLLVVSGPSGAGKGTLCNGLMESQKDIIFSISVTTRPPREGETHGVHYYFVDESTFSEMIDQEELIEYAKVHQHFYGTPAKPVHQAIESGKIVLLEIDVQGALQIRNMLQDGVYVFVAPPSMEELRKRLVHRGTDSEEVINRRIKNASEEMDCISHYDYLIVNDRVEEAIDVLRSVVVAERHRIRRKM